MHTFFKMSYNFKTMTCPTNEIKNPLSGYCITMTGVLAKTLVKKHNKKEVTLAPEDVKKMLDNPEVKVKPIVLGVLNKETEPASKSVYVSSKCDDNKIYNPLTKKCVDKDGSVAKKLVKQKVPLDAANVDKLSLKLKQLAVAPTQPAPTQPIVTPKPIDKFVKKTHVKAKPGQTPIQLPEHVQEKMKKLLRNAQLKVGKRYNTELHSKYCATKKKGYLAPYVQKTFTFKYPIMSIFKSGLLFGKGVNALTMTTSSVIDNTCKVPFMALNETDFKVDIHTDSHNEHWMLQDHLGYRGEKSFNEFVDNAIDYEWFNAQNSYIASLPLKSIITILAYTHTGDVLINSHVRGTLSMPSLRASFMNPMFDTYGNGIHPLLVPFLETLPFEQNSNIVTKPDVLTLKVGKITVDEVLNDIRKGNMKLFEARLVFNIIAHLYLSDSFLKKLLTRFGSDLQNIIENAPKVKKTMVLYRGVKTDYYLKGKEGHYYTNNGFASTSVSVTKASEFTNKMLVVNGKPVCCMKRVTLLPGTKALVIMGVSHYPNEKEILLGLNSKYLVRKAKQRKRFYDNTITGPACYKEHKSMEFYTSDIVVIE